MQLIIVESPAKTRTIKKFLGNQYQIAATLGHVRDLPKKKLGVDIENDFKPSYVVIKGKAETLKKLKSLQKKAKTTILATDPDREGEAIAWHVLQSLKLPASKYQRIVFHEITKEAIESALKSPRKIDVDLVNAQQARRVLDRVVGYKLSPLLWKKITKGLSAGRVQSVALKFVAEREKEIKNFVPQEYWTIDVLLQKIKFKKPEDGKEFGATLIKRKNKVLAKMGIKTKEEAQKIVKDLDGVNYQVEAIEKKTIKRNPPPPFITSTLQQEAWKRFKFPAKFAMQISQQLYEKGFITYHRSDSLNLAKEALEAAQDIIVKDFGKEYWPGSPRKFKTASKVAQEAHEAVRPSYPKRSPQSLREELNEEQYKLYDLIWRRFIACQMSEALFDSTAVDVKAKTYVFRANGQILRFDGFLKVYPIQFEEAELPPLEKGEDLKLKKLNANQHITQPPPRYTEATLVKELEKHGIGRPSTYASIISVIQERNYVNKDDKKKLYPTEIGMTVNDLLVQHFPKIVDTGFTAQMEENLDRIAKGEKEWVPVLKEFYEPFDANLKEKYKELDKQMIETDKKCPKCGKPLVVRISRFGRFYGCSGYPECKFTQPFETPTLGISCPDCRKGQISAKRTKKGKTFFGCNRWPDCNFALWDEPTGEQCPECGSLLVKAPAKKIKCSNRDCNYTKVGGSR